MIRNTKQRNLIGNKIIRSDHVFYLATISPLVCIPVYDPPSSPPLENSIEKRHGFACPDAEPNPIHIYWDPLTVYHSISEFPTESLYRSGIIYLNIKSALRVVLIQVMATVPKFLHISSEAGCTTLSPFSHYASLLVHTMWYFRWWTIHLCIWP